ncbi:MAG: S-layer homology domain-containing protein [Defluviitaleaceae bacterium]|nr:S-layer homology domain-containing protein [Defluviitaleaceae bacterium]
MKFIKKILITTTALVLSLQTAVFARSFADVPFNHFAYESIVNMADAGIMVANMQNQFRPNAPLDKFETSRIFALAAGFRHTNLTVAEQARFQAAYDTHRTLLTSLDNQFNRWNTSSNREIAFLLEEGILTPANLQAFIVVNNSQESLRALSRQEAATFLVRLMGRTAEANAFNNTNNFRDHDRIAVTHRQNVYYLRSLGVISGDTNNDFNPNGVVTRAQLALMLDRTLQLMNEAATTPPTTGNNNNNTTNQATQVVSGTISEVFISINSVRILNSANEQVTYRLNDSAIIVVNGVVRNINALQNNMNMVAIVMNNSIVEIIANSPTTTPPNNNNNNNVSNNISASERVTTGIVRNINSANNTISIEVSIINPRGGIIHETTVYNVTTSTTILRGTTTARFADILLNDIITARVLGNNALEITLEEQNRHVVGTVLEKGHDRVLNTNFYIIRETNGQVSRLNVTRDTEIRRRGQGVVGFNDVRIGDTVDIITEHGSIKLAYAFGERSNVDGVIREIHITDNTSYISLRLDSGADETYQVIAGAFDIYSLRVADRVRLRLDSREVEQVTILQRANNANRNVTGFIRNIDFVNRIVTVSETMTSANTEIIHFDNTTIFTSNITGNNIAANNLHVGMRINATWGASNLVNPPARNITILNN